MAVRAYKKGIEHILKKSYLNQNSFFYFIKVSPRNRRCFLKSISASCLVCMFSEGNLAVGCDIDMNKNQNK